MRRLPLLVGLLVLSAAGASAFLVISAQSDPEGGQEQPLLEPLQPEQQGLELQPQSQPGAGEPAESGDGSERVEPAPPLPFERLIGTYLLERLRLDQRSPGESAERGVQHTIEAGDTLSGIADTYGVNVQHLADANDLDIDAVIHVGDTLQIQPPRTYAPLQTPPGPQPYQGDGLVWGTFADVESGVVHSAVVTFVDPGAGVPYSPAMLVGCIHDRLVVEFDWGLPLPDPAPADLRLYWQVGGGPFQTSLWNLGDEVLSAPNPEAFLDSLQRNRDSRLYVTYPDGRSWFFWFPNISIYLDTPIQPNLDHCGR